MKKVCIYLIISMLTALLGTNFNKSLAQSYEGSYHPNRYDLEQKCLNKALQIEKESNASYRGYLHLNDSLNKVSDLRKTHLINLQQQKIDSLSNRKSYLLKTSPISTRYPDAVISFFYFLKTLAVIGIIFFAGSFSEGVLDGFNLFKILLCASAIIALSIWGLSAFESCLINANVLFEEVKEELETARTELRQETPIFSQDDIISEITQKQREVNQNITTLRDSIKLLIQPEVEEIYQRQVFVRDSIQTAETKKLKEYIRKNNIHKKLKIIVCSWEKEPDIPEHGTLDGDFETHSSNNGGGIGGAILGIGGGLGLGGGSSEGKGKLHGEYTGRVYGNNYHFFHFVLNNNSYHVIDASKNKMWRMARKNLIVKYDKVYSDYNVYTETLTPLYNESSF